MGTESFFFVSFWMGGVGGGACAASVVFSYLRVDLKDRALCGEKRRESCELLQDGPV